MSSISLVCITQNRSKYLNRMLSIMRDYVDEAIVVDGGSVDDTENICKSFESVFLYREWDNNEKMQRNFGLENVKSEWCLIVDDDEFFDYSLLAHIREIIKENDKTKCYAFKRKNFFRYHSWKRDEDLMNFNSDYSIRLFPKGFYYDGIEKNGMCKPHSHFLQTDGCLDFVFVDHKYGFLIHEKEDQLQMKSNKVWNDLLEYFKSSSIVEQNIHRD